MDTQNAIIIWWIRWHGKRSIHIFWAGQPYLINTVLIHITATYAFVTGFLDKNGIIFNMRFGMDNTDAPSTSYDVDNPRIFWNAEE